MNKQREIEVDPNQEKSKSEISTTKNRCEKVQNTSQNNENTSATDSKT